MKRSVQAPEKLLKKLDWTVLRRLDGLLLGDYRTLFRGSGLDLADIREYQPHDDVRHIDWNVTARQQTPYVRQYHEEREISVWFLLDLSPSMDFGSGERSKRDLLIEVFTLLGRLFSRQGNRVGAIIYSAGINRVIPPGAGIRHLLHMIDLICRQPAPESAPETDLAKILAAAMPICKRRSVVFVVSDFISTPGWTKHLALLSERHDAVAVRLLDPLETSLPDLGMLTVQDAETGEQLLVDTHDLGFRTRFDKICEERETALIDDLTRAGIDVLELSTDDDLFDAMMRFIRMRHPLRSSGPAGAAVRAAKQTEAAS